MQMYRDSVVHAHMWSKLHILFRKKNVEAWIPRPFRQSPRTSGRLWLPSTIATRIEVEVPTQSETVHQPPLTHEEEFDVTLGPTLTVRLASVAAWWQELQSIHSSLFYLI